MADTANNSSRRPLKKIILVCVVLALLPISVFAIKPVITLNGMTSKSELGLDDAFTQVSSHCPTNIELELVCLKRYYSTQNDVEIEKTFTNGLEDNGYVLMKIENGYDGPNRIAYKAYSQKKDASLIIVIIQTNNQAYKKGMGNVSVEAYLGRK